jgi:hypothetical protein
MRTIMQDLKEAIVRAIISGEMKELNPLCEGPKYHDWIKSVAEASVKFKATGDCAGAVKIADELTASHATRITIK